MANASAESQPRTRNADATRARLLAAARTEFAEQGFAGARVDRIADTAQVNKRMIYAYFGSKQGLFDSVVEATIERQLDEVPFTAGDLPGYAAGYFDQLVAEPEALRLAVWRSFEVVEASMRERESFVRKVDAIRAAQAAGQITEDIPAVDVLALLLAMTRSWLAATPALRSLGAGAPDGRKRLAEHREALQIAVRQAFAHRSSTPPIA